jgi:hypothetical protein
VKDPPPLLYCHMTRWLRSPRSSLPAVHFRCTKPITSVNIHLPHLGKSGLLGFSHCLIETLTRGHVIELTWGQAVKRLRGKLGNGGGKESRCSATSRYIYRPSDISDELGTNLGTFRHVCRSVSPCRNAADCECLVSSLALFAATVETVRRRIWAGRQEKCRLFVCLFATVAK